MVDLIYYAKLEDSKIIGYYMDGIHGADFCKSISNYIKVDGELHGHLLTLGEAQFNEVKEDRLYTLADQTLFSQVVPTQGVQGPTIEERLASLEDLMMEVL